MLRTIGTLLIGAVPAGALTYYVGFAGSSPEPAGAIAVVTPVAAPGLSDDRANEAGGAVVDDADIERVAASLPSRQRIDFQADALARLALDDPAGALGTALSLGDPAARNTAVQRIGKVWLSRDPLAAISAAEQLPPELKTAYRTAVSREWARIDAEGFLAYADAQPMLDDLLPAMMYAMGSDPERVFEVASRHPPVPVGGGYGDNVTIERTAFASMSSEDPERTLEMLEGMPEDRRRRELFRAYAEIYGRLHPREAMAWARSVEPPNPALVASVITYSTHTDPDQAFDWLAEYEPATAGVPYSSPQYVGTQVGLFAASNPRRAEIASGLLSRYDNPNTANGLRRLARVWMLTDPDSAFDWMVSNASAVDESLAAFMGAAMAEHNAPAAAAYADRVPADLRGAWLREAAAQYGVQDPAGAVSWVYQLQGEPEFESILGQVVQRAAGTDPSSAAQMLLIAPDELQQSVAPGVAYSWAGQDLRQSAQWAVSLSNPAARNTAMRQVAAVWANRDPRAAQQWAVGLPSGEVRDQALLSVLSRLANGEYISTIDRRLFAAFDSPALRQRAEQAVERGQ